MGNNQIISSKDDYERILGQIKQNKYLKYGQFMNLRPQYMQKVISDLEMTVIKSDDKSNKDKNYFLSVIECLDQYSCSKLSSKIHSRLNIQLPHILNLQKITSLDQTHLCSTSQQLYLLLEGFDLTLKQLSDGKLRRKEAFSEEQILLILGKIVEAKVWMNDNGWRALGMDMETIGFVQQGVKKRSDDVDKQTLEGCRCKFIDQDITQLNPSRRQLFDKFILLKANGNNKLNEESLQQVNKIKLPFYLSPQQLEEFNSNKQFDGNYSTSGSGSSKFQVFSLGMLMMQLCCQQEMLSYYSVSKKQDMIKIDFDYESLIHRIAKICYSNELKLLLAEMLEYEQGNRVGFVSLKEKVQKLIIKPFEETRRLKRRSSSTSMLKELLSCSRATELQKDEQKLGKNPFDCISSVSEVKLRVKDQTEKVEKSLVATNTGNLEQSEKSERKQLRKSSSLVSLKCRTNQFLSSTKKQPITNSKTNDASRVTVHCKPIPMINSKLSNQHFSKLNSKAQKPLTNPKTTYQQILKNRLKTQPQKQLFSNDRMESQTDRTVVNGQIYQENETERQLQKGTSSKCINSQLSYVKKKVINLQRLNVQTNLQKVGKQNSADSSTYQQSIADKNLAESSTPYDAKIEVSSQQPTERKTQASFSLRIISDTIATKSSTSLPKLLTQKNRSTSSSMKKLVLNIDLSKNKKTSKDKELVNGCSGNEDIKNEGAMGKGWIMGKLRAKNQAKKTVCNDERNRNIKSECMSTSGKTDQLNSLTLKYESPLQAMPFNNTLTSNDTIIKRLLLTEQKPQKGQKQQGDVCISSSKSDKNHNQTQNCNNDNSNPTIIKMINQESSASCQNDPNKTTKVSESKGVNQFKKKSKIIDIDLSSNFSKSLTSSQQQINANSLLSKNTAKTSKLQKLKQLTIYTQNLEQNSQMNLCGPKAQNYSTDVHSNDKQNSMQNMNRGQMQSIGDKDKKDKQRQEKTQRMAISEQTYQFPHQVIPKTIQCYNVATINLNANLQTKSSNNLNLNEGNSLKTPSNLSEWNRLYGNGQTLRSEEVSDHRKQYSTLTKPFQQIQLNYLGYGQTDRSNIDRFDLGRGLEEDICEEKFDRFNYLSEHQKQKVDIKESCNNKTKLMYTINEDELTFRLKPQSLIGHQVKPFEKQDGSFVMRQENKHLQSSSIIGHNSKHDEKRNTIQELFDDKSKHINRDSEQHRTKGAEKVFTDWQDMLNEKDQHDEMNSECDSMDLSDIEFQRSEHVPDIPNNQRLMKYKHISILEPVEPYYYTQYQHEQSQHNSSSEMANGTKQCFQVALNHITENQSDLYQESSTFRSYLQSARGESVKRIELQNGFVYEGLVNEEGEFQGKGMILRRVEGSKQEKVVYAGQFLNGLYHGFGTLYEISDKERRRLKLPKQCERLSFGVSSAQEKHFSLTSYPINYVGEFRQGQQNGFGTYSFQNGDKFKGNIVKGVVEGFGCYEFADKYIPTIQGCWKQNAFVKNDKK